MPSIITQPTGNKDAREHYLDTIEKSIELNAISKFIGESDKTALQEIYPDGEIKMWGVTSGGANKSKWSKIKRGDITLFSRDGLIYSSAVTTYKFSNRPLAESLWGLNPKGETWENIYTVAEVNPLNIKYPIFNRAVGYKENFVIQGFNVLSEKISNRFLSVFPIESKAIYDEVSNEIYRSNLDDIVETDKRSISHSRVEQGYLRKLLFGNRANSNCACCGLDYPTQFLTTAHIKKRSYCTKEERLNPNVVMPMCNFGCDELFEIGFISVNVDGTFYQKKKTSSKTIQKYIDSVVGKKCNYYSGDTEPFFKWHRELVH